MPVWSKTCQCCDVCLSCCKRTHKLRSDLQLKPKICYLNWSQIYYLNWTLLKIKQHSNNLSFFSNLKYSSKQMLCTSSSILSWKRSEWIIFARVSEIDLWHNLGMSGLLATNIILNLLVTNLSVVSYRTGIILIIRTKGFSVKMWDKAINGCRFW